MGKLIKGVFTLAAALAVLGGIWMVISKILGEEEFDDEYDEYYMDEEDEEDESLKKKKKRGYFSIDLNKAKAE